MKKYTIKSMMLAIALLSLVPLATAIDFTWQDQQGVQHRMDERKGSPVVLHLWASWCFPCRMEMPEMAAWIKKHPKVTVLAVSLDESADDALAFLKKIDMNVPLRLSDVAQVYKLGSRSLPTTVLIDASGNIVSVHRGAQEWNEGAWNDQLLALFKKP